MEELGEADMPAWTYARWHGLVTAFDLDDPRSDATKDLNCMLCNTVPELLVADDLSRLLLHNIADSPAEAAGNERLDVDDDAVGLLHEVATGYHGDAAFETDTTEEMDRDRRTRTSQTLDKMELPLLRTDEEVDLNRVRRLSAVSYGINGIKPFTIEANDALVLGKTEVMLELPIDDLDRERLEVPRHLLHEIKDLMSDFQNNHDDDDNLFAENSISNKRRRMNPITPPLSPRPQSRVKVSQPLVGNDFHPWSEVSDPSIEFLQQLEQDLLEHEPLSMTLSQQLGSDSVLQNNLAQLSETCSPIPDTLYAGRFVPQDKKVEVPLLSMYDGIEANSPTPAILHDSLSCTETHLHPWSGQTDPDLDDAILMLRPHANASNLMLQQETLAEKDCMLRIELPHMAVTDIVPPWQLDSQVHFHHDSLHGELNAQRQHIHSMKEQQFGGLCYWNGASTIERNLSWKPFSDRTARHILEETIDQAGFLTSVLDCMTRTDVVTSDAEAWKPDGLRVLDDHDVDEELDKYTSDKEYDDLSDLLHERKRAMDSVSGKSPSMRDQCCRAVNQQFSPPVSSVDATRNNLQRFFSSRAIRFESRSPEANHQSNGRTLDPRLVGKKTKSLDIASDTVAQPVAMLSLPPLPAVMPRRNFMISCEFTRSRRKLCRQIQKLYPNADFVERDYDTNSNFCTASSLNVSPLVTSAAGIVAEADIIISPAAGLILTNLQKIQQISPPRGTTEKNAFHSRLIQLSCRYEHLTVLICQTVIDDPLDQTARAGLAERTRYSAHAAPPVTIHDVAAISSLNVLAAVLPANIAIQVIVGGERELAGWAVFHMSKIEQEYAISQDQTLWEQILCRAGMNAFAASHVLAVLELDSGSDSSQAFAMGTFLQMSPERRVQTFARDFGGENVLRIVNGCLERAWINARSRVSDLIAVQ